LLAQREPDDPDRDQPDREDPRERRRFAEQHDPPDRRAHRADARPHRVAGADRELAQRKGQ
jgi:hypothetical protein